MLIKSLWIMACLAANAAGQNTLNLETTYSALRAEMNAGGGTIMCIGDSLTYRQGGFFDNFQNLVQSEYGNGGAGYQGFSRWQGAGVNPNWIEGQINQDSSPHRGLDGMWLSHETPTTTSAYIVPKNTLCELIYVAGPQQSSFLFVPSVGGASTVNANDTEGNIAIHVFNSLPNAQSWVYPAVNGYTTLLGVNNLSGGAGPILHRSANGGWGVNNFLQRDFTFDKICQYFDPDLYIIMLGQNDGGMGQAVYESKLSQLRARLTSSNPDCRILYVSSYNSGGPNGLEHSLAMRTVAEQRADGFIDLYTVGGTHQYFLNNGYLDPDGLHFSPAGGSYVSNIVFNALETYGNSLIICDSIDFNQDGFFPDTADIDALLSVFSGTVCPNCSDVDFNNDGFYPDTSDIDSFMSVFSGGPCL